MIKIKPINNSKLPLHLKQLANVQAELIRSTNKGRRMGKEKEDLGYCAYLKKARMALAEEQFEEALKFYDDAISSKDCLLSVYFLKCELLYQLNRVEEGVAFMTKYAHQQDNINFTYFQTSKHFEYRGKMDEATFWLKKYQDGIYGREHYYPEKNKKNSLTLILGGIK